MSAREDEIECYLVEQVKAEGGMCEKFVSPGKRGVPDRLVTWGPRDRPNTPCAPTIHFIELKTATGRLDAWQKRDHQRRRLLGCSVFVLRSKSEVDWYVGNFKQ